MCSQTPECSHRVAYSYMWPTVTNRFPLRAKSLHSTLYTVRVQVSDWTELKDEVLLRILRRELKDVFKEVHRPHDVFILHTKRENSEDEEQRRTAAAADCPAYILAAVDELVDGHHAVFVLVHLLSETERERGEDRHEDMRTGRRGF